VDYDYSGGGPLINSDLNIANSISLNGARLDVSNYNWHDGHLSEPCDIRCN
jgi:hypothetical protein